ncbi:MAG: hypothetical protein LLF76_05720 [Planctomycetaceae bacterium]|nr:hypothetical protein [Planctomycetaceae bacterium]
MSMDQAQPERVRDEKTIAMLKDLSQRLFSGDINKARLAAHQLSWMQEDGFVILKLALFGNYSRNSKKAAAYGLRSMKGRMKKAAVELLKEGLNDRDRTTKAASKKALQLMKILPPDSRRPQRPKQGGPRQGRPGQRRMQDIRSERKPQSPQDQPTIRH